MHNIELHISVTHRHTYVLFIAAEKIEEINGENGWGSYVEKLLPEDCGREPGKRERATRTNRAWDQVKKHVRVTHVSTYPISIFNDAYHSTYTSLTIL